MIATLHPGLARRSVGFVPLAWRNLLANKPRLLRSSGGIGFAVLLMLMQLGVLQRLARSHPLARRRYLQRASKYRFATREFAARAP